jgi:pimeloyl-ACP methyl ester carboxylesterase
VRVSLNAIGGAGQTTHSLWEACQAFNAKIDGRNSMWGGSVIDRWDESAAAEDDAKKVPEPLTVGASLAFRDADQGTSLAALADMVKASTAEADKFYAIESDDVSDFVFDGDILTFRSGIVTETELNNIVHAKVYEGTRRRSAIVVLPHWNAETWGYDPLSRRLARLGLTVVELTLPYHGLRSRPGSGFSDYFVSPNIGRTIRSVRQAVLDTRKTLAWLSDRGYRDIALVGISLGSCVAGLVAAHDERIRASALLLTAGDFSEVVWTGRATQYIKGALAAGMTLDELKGVWSIISTGTFAKELSRARHGILIISGSRDRLVLPCLTERFFEQLRSYQARCDWRVLGCGHYSMGSFPFNAVAFLMLARFLSREGLLK